MLQAKKKEGIRMLILTFKNHAYGCKTEKGWLNPKNCKY